MERVGGGALEAEEQFGSLWKITILWREMYKEVGFGPSSGDDVSVAGDLRSYLFC